MGDAPAELALAGIFLVDMDRIEIARQTREQQQIRFADGLGELGLLADLNGNVTHVPSSTPKNLISSVACPSSMVLPGRVLQPRSLAAAAKRVISGFRMMSTTSISGRSCPIGMGSGSSSAMPIGVALISVSCVLRSGAPARVLQLG